jgi:puromycin-sensitive aminopeptidase
MRRLLPLTLVLLVVAATPAFAQSRLPRDVVPDHYDLMFTVDLANDRFSGLETIRVRVNTPTSRIVLHAVDLELEDVTIAPASTPRSQAQKAVVSLNDQSQTATLTVARPLPQGSAQIQIRYRGLLNNRLRGFYSSKTGQRSYAVTQFEATDARRAFPSFDEPAFKATFDLTLIVDRGDTAISNGRLLSDTPGPGRTQHTLRFSTSPKMSPYLVAMAVGDFRCIAGSQDAIPIRICATPDKVDLGHIALEATRQILKFYNGYYDIKYPFGKLDILAIPDFAAGAMENTAAIFFRETALLADERTASTATRKDIAGTIAHEVAHQWFGDLVTMQWWDDLWLNEGFATWMASHPLAAWKPEWNIPVDDASDGQRALTLDALRSTHPIHARAETPAEIEESFDTITYEKGAAALRMIERYVGAETFRNGVNAYLQAHAYGNATSQDFWTALAAAARRPVDKILPTFVNQPGAPLIEVSLRCEDNRTITRGVFKQQRFTLEPGANGGAPGTVWQAPVCMKIQGSNAAGSCSVLDREQQVIEVAHGCPSWVFINAGADGYFRTAYAPEMLRAMAPEIQTALTPPERLTLVEDEWALVRAGRHRAADYLTVASGFAREQTSGVLALVTARLRFIDDYLTTAATRPKLQAFVGSLVRPSFEALGLEARSDDTDDRRALRAVVVSALGTTADDVTVVAQSRAAVERALAGGVPLDPTAASAVIEIAARHGDGGLYDALAAAAERAATPEEHYRYLNALPGFRDPALIERALLESRSARVRSQDTASYLARFFSNPAARDRAWAFVKENWTELEPRIRIAFGDVRLVRALSAFCDVRARDDIRRFFDAHSLPSAARTIGETLEQIDNCIVLKQKQTPSATEWLANR